MIGLVIVGLVLPVLGMALGIHGAPEAVEGPDGLCVIKPGHHPVELLPLRLRRAIPRPIAMWGLG